MHKVFHRKYQLYISYQQFKHVDIVDNFKMCW